MIITDDFVMLNFPKTGSSFAREVIKKSAKKRRSLLRKVQQELGLKPPVCFELMHKNPLLDFCDQHGTYSQIPPEHLTKKIVTICRNPLERYYSDYLYRWWAKYPSADVGRLFEEYPGFPHINYEQYFDMTKKYVVAERLKGIKPNVDLGAHTIQFIFFYFRNPENVLKTMDENYISSGAYRNDMVNVDFLRQEYLAQDLSNFLIRKCGWREQDVALIGEHRAVNVSDRANDIGSDPHSRSRVNAEILYLDRLLFKIFPDYLPCSANQIKDIP